jgi:hypothetical protein
MQHLPSFAVFSERDIKYPGLSGLLRILMAAYDGLKAPESFNEQAISHVLHPVHEGISKIIGVSSNSSNNFKTLHCSTL